jgi:hypothetical protein
MFKGCQCASLWLGVVAQRMLMCGKGASQMMCARVPDKDGKLIRGQEV